MMMQEEQPDYTQLLARLKAHDLAAFDQLYTHARNRLYVLAYTMVQDSEVARDLVQELFADLWEKKLYRQIQESVIAYLLQAIRNRSLHYLRKQQNRQRLMLQLPAGAEFTTPLPLENAELNKALQAAVDQLPPMAAKVFRLHYIEHLSYAEISLQLGISKSTISSHMDRALKSLRSTLKNKS